MWAIVIIVFETSRFQMMTIPGFESHGLAELASVKLQQSLEYKGISNMDTMIVQTGYK
jgi:hypothetical protein